MKASLFLLISVLVGGFANGQVNPAKVLDTMNATYDQFNHTFDPNAVDDQLIIVYIPGRNDPFGKIYDKHKGKKLAEKVQFIGGFKEMMTGMPEKQKKEHLQEAFVSRYGKDHFTILLDLESEIAQMLSIDGYTILTLSKKEQKIVKRNDFGFDRVEFFKMLNTYFS